METKYWIFPILLCFKVVKVLQIRLGFIKKGGNRDVIERYDTHNTKVTYGKYATRVPDEVAYGIYEWFSSQ